jgi:6-phosphofructokinase 1
MEKKVAVLTSGGDAPGMNAAIRAVVRTSIHFGFSCHGVMRGYQGLIEDELIDLDLRSVANIIQRGGTMLKTAQCRACHKGEGRPPAAATLRRHDISGLIVIGGDGSFRGAEKLSVEHDIQVAGIPGTIDNDIFGTDYTIGFDTALNTALESIDRIRDTAASHERLFLVEVMGRRSGFIALAVGIAAGAELVLTHDFELNIGEVCDRLLVGRQRGKTSSIVIVGEAEKEGAVVDIARQIRDRCGLDYKVTILGHTQRGGTPSARDRLLASKLGSAAVRAIVDGANQVMLGEVGGETLRVPFKTVTGSKKQIDKTLFELVDILSM